jgi:serine/threonine protein kinase/Tfp pilus assembly protein PilF
MSDSASCPDPLAPLADEFLARYRRGERPVLTEYTDRYPELAGQIRELFPALVMMEDVRPGLRTVVGAAAEAGVVDSPWRLGEYRILREIGRGGMGVVYEAEQESLGRRVALKVLPPGALGNAQLVERFRREAKAAARLHHTNIVPVFGVGEDSGTHYYVMQCIEGRPLDEVLAELRRLRAEAGRPESSPTKPESDCPSPAPPAEKAGSSSSPFSDPHRPFAKSVAQLGIQVADALEYAASQGVLHRDVKPSNLLLDLWGTVWLTDFGLAKATGTPDLTRTGHLLGTLRYLAPERFTGAADVRSDIYSLGLTLYEMLALRPAYDGRDQAELTRQITLAEAPRLDRLNPQVPRDLVTIIHKAMAKDPSDRYQTAGALAEDLRRFLDDRSILARRVSLLEQTWRWCRRNPTVGGLLTALLVLGLLSVGGGLWLVWQEQERRAETAWRRGLARQAVESALDRADPRRARGRWQEAKVVLAEIESRLDEADSEELRQRWEQERADLDLAIRLERIRMDRAAFIAGHFAADRAVQDYTAAFAEAGVSLTQEETAEKIRNSAIREQLVAALDDWALATSNPVLRWGLERLASSVDPDPQWRNRLPGPLVWNERAALERLAAEAPVAQLSPQFLNVLGVRLRGAGADPESFMRRAQRLHPADFWLNYDLGMALLRNGKPAEAVGFFRAAVVARPDCSHAYTKLGMALIQLGKTEEAVGAYHRALDLDDHNAGAHFNLAEALADQGQTQEAAAEYQRAIAADPHGATYSHSGLALVLEARGKPKEAMAEYRRAIALEPRSALLHHNLGKLLAADGQVVEALAEYRRAIALDPKDAAPHLELGRCLHNQGDLDPAIAEYRRAIELEPQSGPTRFQLGAALQARGRTDEAIAQFRKAVEVSPQGALGYDALSAALLRRGRFAEAREVAQRALDAFPADEPLRPSLRQTLEQSDRLLALETRLPDLLQGQGQPVDAGERLAQARLFREHGRPYAAARLFAAAFAANPALADELPARNRYEAACAAARAAADQDSAEAGLDEAERAGLRHQAHDWLRADLAQRARQRQGSPSAAAALKTWPTDAALAGVRDQALLEKLPGDERQQWRRLWADVDVVLGDDPLEQGRAHAARRNWDRAADSYTRALKLGPIDDGHFWFEYAGVLLLSGDREGYARACTHMIEKHIHLIEKYGKAPDLRAYHVARACSLTPDAVAAAARPDRLAEKELTEKAGEFWAMTEQGALHYRAGRFAKAAALFEQSLQADAKPGRAVLNWLWLALADQRLDKPEEARRWLDKAAVWLDEYRDGMPNRAEEELGLHLHNWLEAHVLRREAEALLGTGPAGGKESGPTAFPNR